MADTLWQGQIIHTLNRVFKRDTETERSVILPALLFVRFYFTHRFLNAFRCGKAVNQVEAYVSGVEY